MKRSLLINILLLTLLLSVFTGQVLAETRLLIGTGGLAGVYYPIGSAIGTIINKYVDDTSATAQTTAAGVENARLLKMGEIDFGLVQTSAGYFAHHGLKTFENDQNQNLRGVAVLYPQPMQIVVAEDSDIREFKDLIGKKVGIGAPASGEEVTFREIIEVAGLSLEDFEPHFISLAEQAAAFKDRQIDAMWFVSGIPTSGILDVASVRDIRLVPIEGSFREDILEEYPYHVAGTVPAGTYPNQDNDVETLCSPAYLVCTTALSEDLVYNIVKAMFEHNEELIRAHAQGKNITLENALTGSPIPLHPGAEKYYREMGLVK